MAGLLDFLQGASNAAASNVSAPIDGLAWLLRKMGADVGTPMGGSDWMRQKGLTAEPQNKWAGLLGESVGGLAPIIAAAKAPQIASGLLKGAENLAAPQYMNRQAGMVRIAPLREAQQSQQKNAYKEIEDIASSLEKDWAMSGYMGEKIFAKIPNNKIHFDVDDDLTDAGHALYLQIQRKMALESAAQNLPKNTTSLADQPKLAADYAKWYAEQKGVPVFSAGGSSKSQSTYLPVGSNNRENALTMRFSNHELPEHYVNDAQFQFGNFDGGVTDTAKLRSFIRGLK